MARLWGRAGVCRTPRRAFNVIVCEDRAVVEMTARRAVSGDGGSDIRGLRSGLLAEDRLPEQDAAFRNATGAARDPGAIIRDQPTNQIVRTVIN